MRKEFSENKCTYGQADIYIAGDITLIKHYCAEYCMSGLCVSVFECEYIYTGGRESGAKITLINYARFPKTQDGITQTAKSIGHFLCVKLHQSSFSVVTPLDSFFISRRDD